MPPEQSIIRRALVASGWRLRRAAGLLDYDPAGLLRRIRLFGDLNVEYMSKRKMGRIVKLERFTLSTPRQNKST